MTVSMLRQVASAKLARETPGDGSSYLPFHGRVCIIMIIFMSVCVILEYTPPDKDGLFVSSAFARTQELNKTSEYRKHNVLTVTLLLRVLTLCFLSF